MGGVNVLRRPILSSGGAFLVRPPRWAAMDGDIKNRPAHQLAGAHRRGAIYSSRRAPCEKPRRVSVSNASQRHS
ncbi:hypothetical protein NSND_62119 [Nitrospira sp. ND1]|nr:hypothetical protein NSND_62119 [Nitrospira sp. ND1]